MSNSSELTDAPVPLSQRIDDPVTHVSSLDSIEASSWRFVSFVVGEDFKTLRQSLNNENVRAFIISIGVVFTLCIWAGALFFGYVLLKRMNPVVEV